MQSQDEAVPKPCLIKCDPNDGETIVSTFEGLSGGHTKAHGRSLPFVNGWGVTPQIDTETAYCGKRSLFFPNSFGRLQGTSNGNSGIGTLNKGDDEYWWSKSVPFVCMAYKIPATSDVQMKVHFEVRHRRYTFRYIAINGSPEEEKGWVWPGIVADNEWHHGCINIQQMIDAAADAGEHVAYIGRFTKGQSYKIKNLEFYNRGVGPSSFSSNPFWIDEFSVSANERRVQKMEYPETGPLQLIEVVRSGTTEAISWTITLSTATDDCQTPKVNFAMDVTSVQNHGSHSIQQVQQHSPPIEGNLVLRFKEEVVQVSPYASAAEFQEKLRELPSLGDTRVVQTGTCQAGYGWVVQFLSSPGDQPMIQASLSLENDAENERASVSVEEMEAGGVLISPIPADYFRQVSQNPADSSVELWINDVLAECEGDCSFEFRDDLTPTFIVESQSPLQNEVGNYLITLTGSKLSSGEAPIVDVQGFPCILECEGDCSYSEAQIVCKVNRPFLEPKEHPVSVIVPGRGRALNQDSSNFHYRLEIESISPSTFDPAYPQTLTVHGAGFHPVLSRNKVAISDAACDPIRVSADKLVCALNPRTSARRSTPSLSFFIAGESGENIAPVSQSASVTFETLTTPIVSSISPSSGSAAGGEVVTLIGTDFPDDPMVLIGTAECAVQMSSTGQIVCCTAVSAPGRVTVSVQYRDGQRTSDPTNAPAFEYILRISDFTPSSLGLGGGVTITVNGEGLMAGSDKNVSAGISIAGEEHYVVGVWYSSAAPLQGSWTLSMDDKTTQAIDVAATSYDVKNAIMAANFDSIIDIEVCAADNMPGTFLNAKYSRQWELRMQRAGVEGLSLDRCTSPLYVDWDPNACPQSAADLFLHHYWWYWPVLLPEPADLREESYGRMLQAKCDNEARSLGFRPGFCQALVPKETLSTCGQGSGINPPCWETRFTRAKIQLNDGTHTLFERDDSKSMGDATKGFRFWKRVDFDALALRRSPSVSDEGLYTESNPAGVHISSGRTIAEQWVPLITVDGALTASQMKVVVPSNVSSYTQSYGSKVQSKLFKYEVRLFDLQSLLEAEFDFHFVRLVPSMFKMSRSKALQFNAAEGSVAVKSFDVKYNRIRFSVDFWLSAAPTQDRVPVVRSVDGRLGIGYALILSGDRCEFWIGTGLSNDGPNFSKVHAQCVFADETSVHVGVTYDGSMQNLYISGVLVDSKQVQTFEANHGLSHSGEMIIGGHCREVDGVICGSTEETFFEGTLEQILWYPQALSADFIASHANSGTQTMSGTVKVMTEGVFGTCVGDCTVELSTENTPIVVDVSPVVGWTGSIVTITGQLFFDSEFPHIQIGSRPCSQLQASESDSKISCTIQEPQGDGGFGVLPVVANFPNRGSSIGTATILMTSAMTSVSPSSGSILGGTNITIGVSGLPSDISRISIHVGDFACQILSSDSGKIVCALGMIEGPVEQSRAIAMRVDGVAATCTDNCVFETSADPSSTPVFTYFFVYAQSNVLHIESPENPLPTHASPVVSIGSMACTVQSYSHASISCVFERKVGGLHHLKVQYPQGFASYMGPDWDQCCPMVRFPFEITAVVPTQGSQIGGQMITISGSHFPSRPSEIEVSIGGSKCTTESAVDNSVVILIPPHSSRTSWLMGVEQLPMSSVRNCHTHKVCSFSEYTLISCAALFDGIITSPRGSAADVLTVGPASETENAPEIFLIDSDLSTIWDSKNGEEYIKIALDLKSVHTIEAIVIHWAQESTANKVQVSVGSSCNDLTVVVPWIALNKTGEWDNSDTLMFIASQVRIVVLELDGTQVGMQDFRIRDLAILDFSVRTSSLPLKMWVGSELATAQDLFDVSTSPVLSAVHPASATGFAGTIITVHGSGFRDDNNCAYNSVMMGSERCVVVNCDTQFLECEVPSQVSGTYNIQVHVEGFGYAKSSDDIAFTQIPQITAVQPSIGSLGGGLLLTVQGSGFDLNSDVKICGRTCTTLPASISTSNITCMMNSVQDTAATIDLNKRSLSVSSPSDEAYVSLESKTLVLGSSVLPFGFPVSREDLNVSDKEIYLRFTGLDIPSGARVSGARLYVRSSRHCPSGSVIRLWALDTDTSEPFDPSQVDSLKEQIRTSHHDWILEHEWNWAGDQQESADISSILNQVFSRPGWNSASSLTLVLQQRSAEMLVKMRAGMMREGQSCWCVPYGPCPQNCGTGLCCRGSRSLENGCDGHIGTYGSATCALPTEASCEIFGSSFNPDYAPQLKMTLDENSIGTNDLTSVRTCSIDVQIQSPRVVSDNVQSSCPRQEVQVRPTDAATFSSRKLRKVFMKEQGSVLSWADAHDLCERNGARLCMQNEVFESKIAGRRNQDHRLPFFGLQADGMAVPLNVPQSPTEDPWSPVPNMWLQVSQMQTPQNSDTLTILNPQWGLGCGWEPRLVKAGMFCRKSRVYFSSYFTSLSLSQCFQKTRDLNKWHFQYIHAKQTCLIYWNSNEHMSEAFCSEGFVASSEGSEVVGGHLQEKGWAYKGVGLGDFYAVTYDCTGEYAKQNQVKTTLTPCCGNVGQIQRPHLALDGNPITFWQSGPSDVQPILNFELVNPASVHGLEIKWTEKYAVEFSVQLSQDGAVFTEVFATSEGDGEVDQITMSLQHEHTRWTHLRVVMRRSSSSTLRYGIKELLVLGARQCTSMLPKKVSALGLFEARPERTPTISNVAPDSGSTAGGADVTVTGQFFTSDISLLRVSIGQFPCDLKSAEEDAGIIKLVCLSSASGVTNGGKKHVTVTVKGYGSSVAMDHATFWYIDKWSARTTWGGNSPPTGCGSWHVDKQCTETVIIPEGQVVLLDQSLPRFYLLLIQGTLIFDRKDLELSASYILVHGGSLQIGTEDHPFLQNVKITLHGHPKQLELPTFGVKVIACYRCTMDIHGAPQISWTTLSATVYPGDSEIRVQHPVNWPVGSKIAIANTDFETNETSHTEVATVQSIGTDGRTIEIGDIRVCPEYTKSGVTTKCMQSEQLSYVHLGEKITFAEGHALGREVEMRAEVGLLSRNIVIEGDYDQTLCPLAEFAEDGITRLSCNQFGAQMWFHSPGHESLVARISNFELRNGGQAFRLGRYAVHWHMVGNLRQSFQKNISVHHSWNRGTAVHGVHHLRLESNILFRVMGHSFFIEDGVEEHNVVKGNLALLTIPSNSLLNTDQTPAGFWIVSGKNRILNNHGVASINYGMWFRPEISATGTSFNTPMAVHPINIPLLEFDGNVVHSNGVYGLRIFDRFDPNEASVFRNTVTWRNGQIGFTATGVGRVAHDGVVAIQNAKLSFEGRFTSSPNWLDCYIANSMFVDWTGLPHSNRSIINEGLGTPQAGGVHLPWNSNPGGGMVVKNTIFVNFHNGCLRGCAHCGRAGSPKTGDMGAESRFSAMSFHNSSQRAMFRAPTEAFFYDLDGTLTNTGVQEDYSTGGTVRGSSLVGRSILLPPLQDGSGCLDSHLATVGIGAAVCRRTIFRIAKLGGLNPSSWVGKALCIRPSWQSVSEMNMCVHLCTCLGLVLFARTWLKISLSFSD